MTAAPCPVLMQYAMSPNTASQNHVALFFFEFILSFRFTFTHVNLRGVCETLCLDRIGTVTCDTCVLLVGSPPRPCRTHRSTPRSQLHPRSRALRNHPRSRSPHRCRRHSRRRHESRDLLSKREQVRAALSLPSVDALIPSNKTLRAAVPPNALHRPKATFGWPRPG